MASRELVEQNIGQKLKTRFNRIAGPWGIFFKGFLKNPVMVGAILPSSQSTIDAMLSKCDWAPVKLFVEYGPGVGTFTRPILDRLPRDGTLIVIDTNPDFIKYLDSTISDSRLIPVLGSAADVEEIIESHGFDHADYVLSGLPFSTLPDGIGPAISKATHKILRKGGAFLVYQYSAKCREFMKLHFSNIDNGIVLRNIPPCKLFWGWKE